MALDRGRLAKVDRRLLAGLGQDETFRMVRVPVTVAKWSTWKRYCDSKSVSMGRAIVTLIDHELMSVFGESGDVNIPVLAREAEEQLAARQGRIATRERGLEATEDRLRSWAERLRVWEDELRDRERQVDLVAKVAARPRASPKVGRNEPCPCGSGLKYKHCHGQPRRQPVDM
ncbi:preprotein translocase subunit SecA [bacterium BMS3Bbin01]|nr:preprotein translocase subunit SecA [bacterium BMS3Bbin01]